MKLHSNELKKILYELHEYSFPVPSGYTGNWDQKSWVTFIDLCRGWHFPWGLKLESMDDELLDRVLSAVIEEYVKSSVLDFATDATGISVKREAVQTAIHEYRKRNQKPSMEEAYAS